jgi:hypothetical protein
MAIPVKYNNAAPIKTYGDSAHELSFESIQVCGQKVKFLSFITSFTQTFASNWNTEAVYGRIDPIGTFQGNQRNINVGWDVPAGTLSEATNNQTLISTLIKMLYPSYEGGNNALTLSKSPLIRIKYSSLISDSNGGGLLGYITSLSWNPVIEMGFFQEGQELYPKVISLNIDFNVLHEGDKGWSNNAWLGKGATFPFN